MDGPPPPHPKKFEIDCENRYFLNFHVKGYRSIKHFMLENVSNTHIFAKYACTYMNVCVCMYMTMYVCLLRGGFMFKIPIIMSTIMHSKEGGRGGRGANRWFCVVVHMVVGYVGGLLTPGQTSNV